MPKAEDKAFQAVGLGLGLLVGKARTDKKVKDIERRHELAEQAARANKPVCHNGHKIAGSNCISCLTPNEPGQWYCYMCGASLV